MWYHFYRRPPRALCGGGIKSLEEFVMSRNELNILITAASRRVPLIRGFRQALTDLGVEGNVVSTDINPLSPGLYVSDRWHFAPLTNDPGYADRLLEICEKESISLIVPTIDNELELMATLAPRFAQKGVKIVISSHETALTCNDKWRTFQFFKDNQITTPQTWLPDDLPDFTAKDFPLFLKPRYGRGSIGIHPIRNKKELMFFTNYVRDPLLQQFLEGPEFTLDTFCDFEGQVISVVPRERLWVRSGVMDKGKTVKDQQLIDIGVKVAEALDIRGPANTQVKFSKGKPYVFEVNPRFSGGIPLTINAGADFPRMLCKLMLGQPVKQQLGEFEDGLVMMSYEDNIFRKIETGDFDSIKKKLV